MSLTSDIPRPPTRSQTDVVVDEIKKMITSGQLTAGSRLPVEKELASELRVSRGSLREGVRALCIMGVLETRQGDGTYVTSLDASLLLAPMSFMVDLHSASGNVDLQSVRRVLETEAAGRAALRISADELQSAQNILADVFPFISAPGRLDYDRIMEADIDFHRVIAKASRNPALEALIEALASRTVRDRLWRAIREEGAIGAAHGEHQAILAALAAHDPDVARLRMGSHLLAVEEFMQTEPVRFVGAAHAGGGTSE